MLVSIVGGAFFTALDSSSVSVTHIISPVEPCDDVLVLATGVLVGGTLVTDVREEVSLAVTKGFVMMQVSALLVADL